MNFSFAGCGFLGIYHVGVASCLKQHAPQLVEKATFLGASAGALVCTCLLCGIDIGECTSFVLRLATKARSRALGPLHPSFDISRILRDVLDSILPDNAHEIVRGRLYVSLTRVSDKQAVLVSEFHSKADLIQALLCSAHVPLYSGLIPPSFHGTRYVDGGLSDNLPILNDETITVSPFAGESDICPSDNSSNFEHIILVNTSMQLTSRNLYRISRALFPPHPSILSDMCTEGFDDCLKFLQKNNLISCTRHLKVKSSIRPVQSSCQLDTMDVDQVEGEESILEEEEEDPHGENCQECRQKVQGALTDTLPPTVAEAFQVACDSMNKGFQSYIHRHKALRVASLMVAPWFLPADIVYNYTLRVLEYLPSLPNDMRVMSQEVLTVLRHLLHQFQHTKRKYRAQFTCQLAITEINYGNQPQLPNSLTMSPYQPEPINPSVRNLNIGFAVDFETESKDPVQSIGHIGRHLNQMDINHVEVRSEERGRNIHLNMTGDQASNQLFDTFEQCLLISNEMESAMAYYYKDESNRECYNVQEIYDIDSVGITLPSPTELSSGQDLSDSDWHSYLESKPDIENEVGDRIQEVLAIPEFQSGDYSDSTQSKSEAGEID
ncbi:patatin-like phospholipase domain-containing protein 2 [Saccostrea echinata]|uniref:patatin-like phospholipase domain-containing protein 2 n=1 Tax=Saccostrea echinata TaxID=191078 RepID=UPI002A80DF68|nr:patatin-like phospholipase domain-containing protein 2 [Saccostrea echinata]